MSLRRASIVWVVLTACAGGGLVHAQRPDEPAGLMDRVGAYVAEYYARAQSIVGVESVSVSPLARDLSVDGHVRRLVYDFRVEWEPATDGPPRASVLRELVSIDGKPPRPDDEPDCLDPKSLTPEPLAMFLRGRQQEYTFTRSGPARMDGQASEVFEYRSRTPGTPMVAWRDHCATIELPGRTRGKVWLDPDTAEILRLDEGIIGLFDFIVPRDQQRNGSAQWLTIERADTSIRYKPVRFSEPDETLMLPASIDTLTIVRNAGTPRVRIRKTYSGYRRFVTEGRLVP